MRYPDPCLSVPVIMFSDAIITGRGWGRRRVVTEWRVPWGRPACSHVTCFQNLIPSSNVTLAASGPLLPLLPLLPCQWRQVLGSGERGSKGVKEEGVRFPSLARQHFPL